MTSDALQALEYFGHIRRSLNLSATQMLKPLGIGPKQALILRQFAQQRVCSQAYLSRATASDPAAIGRAVETLLRKGYLLQRANPDDRRCWEVSLTPKGKKTLEAVEACFTMLAGQLVQNLTRVEQKQFRKILGTVAGSMSSDVKRG